jgi:uncharacterized protein YjdB
MRRKKNGRKSYLAMVLFLSLLCMCFSFSAEASASNKITKIKLSKTSVTLQMGKTVNLKATITPSTAGNKSLTWSSSNKKVATVTSAGKVKAVGKGKATITAKAKDGSKKAASCIVTVTAGGNVTKVQLNQASATLTKGNTLQLKATVSPSNASNKNVTWSSSNKNVATVDAKGKVTAKGNGTATITAKAADGSKKSASCKVTVNVKASGVELDQTSVTLKKGKTRQLKATVSPSNASNKNVTWSSSNQKIAVVDSNGKVTAKGKGIATIVATAADGSKKSASCKFTVTEGFDSTDISGRLVELWPGSAKQRATVAIKFTNNTSDTIYVDWHMSVFEIDQVYRYQSLVTRTTCPFRAKGYEKAQLNETEYIPIASGQTKEISYSPLNYFTYYYDFTPDSFLGVYIKAGQKGYGYVIDISSETESIELAYSGGSSIHNYANKRASGASAILKYEERLAENNTAKIRCPMCISDTGKCVICKGEKKYSGKTCASCKGTGICPICEGTGWY